MGSRILIIQGHPDPRGGRYCHSLADAYADGAEAAGHEVRRLAVATMSFPWLRSKQEFEEQPPPESIIAAQKEIQWAECLFIVYPLWMGDLPAVLKAFLEQTLRPGFAVSGGDKWPKRLLKGRRARIVVTMWMPAFIYRWFYRAHSLKSLKRNILGICGVSPIQTSLIGAVEDSDSRPRKQWLDRMRGYGGRAI
ncbi:flavodoxin family protein [Hahella sp. KA22]|uniref:NAD(P)H-dependent oxidoreductase n=1 Tax=Hahella sp. KA22 TaxID=1628392 RepID=UPI000FDDEDBA|nr:NAD(P)H-dependent oxidoreductase [Hahella sp. KA22]AZZ93445.1 flavodoxin family protein [Hahella sp. KA22]QAY56820.1 flavodoxin family protein [Hahella sp. KA22]